MALVGIVDPPRAEAREAIKEAHAAGIQVRMITGDHAITAEAIARQLGIEGEAITGAEFSAMADDEADRRIDGIGVIARVAPEDKVRLVEILRRKGHIVAMTGDGVNDAPALKMADIGVAMGITGTEVSKEAAVMILTDDNFATIVKAVELGRALYDNLLRYIRFQMTCLFGFIGTFLGASIFNILGGVPFLPLQTLWINFTIDILQAIGLGYGKPREGLMEEKPRPKAQVILPRQLFLWLAGVGIFMAAGTLGVIVWAGNQYDDTVAHTMGLVTFSLFHLFYSLETANAERTLFSSELLENPILLRTSALSVVTIFLATAFGPLQRVLDTVELSPELWAVCIVVAGSVIVVEEVRKADPPARPVDGGRDHRTDARAHDRVVRASRLASSPMSVIIPRWEFRTFGQHFGAAEAAFGAMTPGAVQESDEVYLLVDDGQPTTDVVKIRFDLMDVKTLREVNSDGLERWEPVAKVAFPIAPADMAIVTGALRLPSTPSDKAAAKSRWLPRRGRWARQLGARGRGPQATGPLCARWLHRGSLRRHRGRTADPDDRDRGRGPGGRGRSGALGRSRRLRQHELSGRSRGAAGRPAAALRGDRCRDELGQVPRRRAPG